MRPSANQNTINTKIFSLFDLLKNKQFWLKTTANDTNVKSNNLYIYTFDVLSYGCLCAIFRKNTLNIIDINEQIYIFERINVIIICWN